jgi:hypothetical protein
MRLLLAVQKIHVCFSPVHIRLNPSGAAIASIFFLREMRLLLGVQKIHVCLSPIHIRLNPSCASSANFLFQSEPFVARCLIWAVIC